MLHIENCDIRSTIDRQLSVSWCIEFDYNMKWFESSEGRSHWVRARDLIQTHQLKIKRVHLFSINNIIDDITFNGTLTPEYAKGYFFSQKVSVLLGNPVVDTYGIGYVNKNNILDIRWYDNHMSLLGRETRSIQIDQISYINNNI